MNTFIVYGFIDQNNNPYYIFYTSDFKQEWQIQNDIVNHQQNHEAQYEFARKLKKMGVPFILEILESDIPSEREAIKKTFEWIEKFRSQGIKLVNKFFDKDGNELDSSPHKEKIKDDRKNVMNFLWLPFNKEKMIGDKRNRPRTEEVKKKISIAKTGRKNPSAKKYMFTDPNGKRYVVVGGFDKFCKEHGLRVQSMRELITKKKKWKHCKKSKWTVRIYQTKKDREKVAKDKNK